MHHDAAGKYRFRILFRDVRQHHAVDDAPRLVAAHGALPRCSFSLGISILCHLRNVASAADIFADLQKLLVPEIATEETGAATHVTTPNRG
jgi:hypothetical protein